MLTVFKTKFRGVTGASTIIALLFGMIATGSYFQSSTAQGERVKLSEGTVVVVKLTEPVTSENKNQGDLIHFQVARDVTVDGNVVIKGGTAATGEVVSVRRIGAVGQRGEIVISISYTKSVDGQTVPLRSTLGRTGESKLTTSVVLSYFICPLFLLKKGKPAEFPIGSEFKVYVDRDMEIQLTPER